MNLSKSKYCAGVFCPKILWMDKNMPEQKATQDDTRMEVGQMVGGLARGYFGMYSEVPFNGADMGGMLAETQRLLVAGTEIIAEAAFSYDGNFCSVDILRKGSGGYEIVEVKSASGTADDTPENIEQTHLDDMAYQYYVVTHCGLPVTKISLMRLNKEYIRRGELDLQELFVLTDCTDIIMQMQGGIAENIERIKAAAAQEAEPEIQIDSKCKGCVYQAWCLRRLPENNVFTIGFGLRGNKKDALYRSGLISFEDVLNSDIVLSFQQYSQIETAVHNAPPTLCPYRVYEFLNGLTYPLYHLDFETYQQPIPLFDGVKPYQQIPFQYSLHIQDTPCGEPIHKEFLGKEGTDPRRVLAERLCADIPQDACVLAYNAAFEKGRIRELAAFVPELAGHLMRIHDNIKDLAEPFAKGYYYCRAMGGSYSIKAVLPALCGDNPELDYHKLDLIHHGGEAMAAFSTLHEQPPDEIARIRAALLAYCRLDTLAMVKILEKLYKVLESAYDEHDGTHHLFHTGEELFQWIVLKYKPLQTTTMEGRKIDEGAVLENSK